MYACMHDIDGGFIEGVYPPNNTTANFHDPPPPPHNSRIYSREREPKQRSTGQIGCRLPRSLGRVYEVRP